MQWVTTPAATVVINAITIDKHLHLLSKVLPLYWHITIMSHLFYIYKKIINPLDISARAMLPYGNAEMREARYRGNKATLGL